jgi:hypothetical protein
MSIDKNTLLLGKILGEIYRMQSKAGLPCSAGPERVYGLLHGFEREIDDELESIGFVSDAQVDAVAGVLEPIWQDREKTAAITGFYNIEPALESVGINRSVAINVLTYFSAARSYTEIISKFNSRNSPIECQTFDLDSTDK